MRKISKWPVLCTLAALAVSGCGPAGQSAEGSGDEYPAKPIQLIVPWDAGGDTDAIYRLVSKQLEEELGGTVVIKNISGGSGSVGAQQALSAPNDGYTLLAIHDSVAISNAMGKTEFGYSDFEPVALMTSTYEAVATHPDNPWENLTDVIEDASKDPGSVSYAASIGSTSQLEPLLLQSVADIQFNIVGFEGTAARMKAIVGNDIDLGGVTVVAAKDYLDAGDMKLLAYLGDERNPAIPDVPTAKEQGFDVTLATNRGVVAPKGTPQEVLEKLSQALQAVANSEELKEKMARMGTDLNFKGREEYSEYLESNEKLIKEELEKAGALD